MKEAPPGVDPGQWISQLLQALGTASDTAAGGPVDAFVKPLTRTLAQFADAASARVVGIAALRALVAYSGAIRGLLFGRIDTRADRGAGVPKEQIRLALGRSLALALEFELGADILRSAVTPTWNDILHLAAIIL